MCEVFKRITKDETDLALHAVIEGRSSKKQSRKVSRAERRRISEAVASGADVNFLKNIRGITSLNYSCYEGNKEIVELLLNRGANDNDIDENGVTPFLSFVKNRNFDFL